MASGVLPARRFRRATVTGEQLSAGWDPVLRLLEGVPADGDAAAIGLAFQSVALLASDYASALPPPLLRKCLQVAALYGGQQVPQGSVALTPPKP